MSITGALSELWERQTWFDLGRTTSSDEVAMLVLEVFHVGVAESRDNIEEDWLMGWYCYFLHGL